MLNKLPSCPFRTLSVALLLTNVILQVSPMRHLPCCALNDEPPISFFYIATIYSLLTLVTRSLVNTVTIDRV